MFVLLLDSYTMLLLAPNLLKLVVLWAVFGFIIVAVAPLTKHKLLMAVGIAFLRLSLGMVVETWLRLLLLLHCVLCVPLEEPNVLCLVALPDATLALASGCETTGFVEPTTLTF